MAALELHILATLFSNIQLLDQLGRGLKKTQGDPWGIVQFLFTTSAIVNQIERRAKLTEESVQLLRESQEDCNSVQQHDNVFNMSR